MGAKYRDLTELYSVVVATWVSPVWENVLEASRDGPCLDYGRGGWSWEWPVDPIESL